MNIKETKLIPGTDTKNPTIDITFEFDLELAEESLSFASKQEIVSILGNEVYNAIEKHFKK